MSGQNNILETEALRMRRTTQVQLVAMLLMTVVFAQTLLPQNMTISSVIVLVALAALVGYRFVVIGFAKPGIHSDALVATPADGYRAQARNGWLMVLIMLSYLVFKTSSMLDQVQSGIAIHRLPPDQFQRSGALSPVLVGLLLLGAAFSFAWPVVWFRGAKNRTLQTGSAPVSRAAALKFGYLVTVALLGAGFVAVWMGMAEPLHFLLWAMLAAVAAPVLLYVALETRAG